MTFFSDIRVKTIQGRRYKGQLSTGLYNYGLMKFKSKCGGDTDKDHYAYFIRGIKYYQLLTAIIILYKVICQCPRDHDIIAI